MRGEGKQKHFSTGPNATKFSILDYRIGSATYIVFFLVIHSSRGDKLSK